MICVHAGLSGQMSMEVYMDLLQQHYLLGRQQAMFEAQAVAMAHSQQWQVSG